nr:hypothetical protein [Nocardioides sp. B-3]
MGRALQGAAARRWPSWASRWTRSTRRRCTRAGTYREQILHAIKHRDRIDEVLGRYRTKAAPAAETEEEEASPADSVANEDFEGTGDLSRFPYKPWCGSCGRDTTDVTAYDDESTDLDYTCRVCGFVGSTNVATQDGGKLVWKVDWPMRWAWEKVDFEPAGLDHMTPGSSYTVGRELVSSIFDWQAPARVTYAFVGIAGMQKMSSSSGGVPTPADALAILEAPMVRWLYTRRAPKQAFTIDFGPEVVRLYDEWDALRKKASDPAKPGRRGARLRAGVLDGCRRSIAGAVGGCPLPDALLGRRRHRGLRRPDQPGRRARRLPARLRRRHGASPRRGRWRGPRRCRSPSGRPCGPPRTPPGSRRSPRTRSCGCGSSWTGCPRSSSSTR